MEQVLASTPLEVHSPGLQDCDRQQQLQACMPPLLHQFILATRLARQPLVCIDFGSMGHMGLITDPHHLVSVLTTALQTATAKGILLTGMHGSSQAVVHMLAVCLAVGLSRHHAIILQMFIDSAQPA